MRLPKKSALKHLKMNIIKFSTIKKAPSHDYGTYIIQGCKYHQLKEAETVYRDLNGKNFSNIQKILLKLYSKKSLLVAVDKSTHKIVSINLFYVNHRDYIENTIHGGYIGVLPDYEGKGIATNMRKFAKSYFKKSGFSGISSRISKNNIASLKTAEKVGFTPIEEYYDNILGEERYYLRCNLNSIN